MPDPIHLSGVQIKSFLHDRLGFLWVLGDIEVGLRDRFQEPDQWDRIPGDPIIPGGKDRVKKLAALRRPLDRTGPQGALDGIVKWREGDRGLDNRPVGLKKGLSSARRVIFSYGLQ